MSEGLLHFLDYFFIVFHSIFTLFNIVGWIWRQTRKIHLITVALTLLSWFVLGIWYGWGYCVCTDWHWQIRARLMKPVESNSYIHFLVKTIFGTDLNEKILDNVVMIIFLGCIGLSVGLFIRDRFRKKKLKISVDR